MYKREKRKGENSMYKKPAIVKIDDLAEGVYTASGDGSSSTDTAQGKCDSKYMNGEYHVPTYTDNNYMDGLGCNGCPASRAQSYCALTKETYWESYDADNGNRMPSWEKDGKNPYDTRW
jgi:hypothetical protein